MCPMPCVILGPMNVIGLIIEITGWLAFTMMFAVVYLLHHAAKRMKAEREKDRLPIHDLLHRI